MKRTVIAMGLQETGKTTFLAAFWDVVRSRDVVGSLRMETTFGDMQYLNEIHNAWADCNKIIRTGPASDKPVTMLLHDESTNTSTELAWTDMLGESFERQWTERAWTRSYQTLVNDAVGVVLFVHPKQLKESQLIIDAQEAVRQVAQPQTEAPSQLKSSTESDAADPSQPVQSTGSPSQSPGESAVVGKPPVEQAKQFDARTVPTQVPLVELLQFVDAHRSTHQRFRVSLVVSAWDLIEELMGMKITPEKWCAERLPLLDQFLASNDDRFDTMIFGVSAQGGDYSKATELRKAHYRAANRIKVVYCSTVSHDITAPVRWAIGSAIG